MVYLLSGFFFLVFGVCFVFLVLMGLESVIISFDFSSLGSSDFLDAVLYFDWMGCCFMFVLFFMVSSVLFFSYTYMKEEVNKIRFFSLVFLFVASMVVLILVPNMVFFFLGWDGLGFTSFLLVAWFGCFFSRSASLKTFLVKRFGDSLLLMGMVKFFYQGHFNLFVYSDKVIWFVGLVVVLATFTKSAQFPFSSWLPAAMAAPTPVSSLVHSSTLVTAGIYFLIRFKNLFSYNIFYMICMVGLFTMFFSSFCAIMEMDVKKVVAFSTLSQLGFMCFCVGVKYMKLCFFYLLVHACFKALMFISVGVFMVYGGHNQDIRKLSKLWYFKPLVFLSLFISVLSLSGVPLLSGFIFKDLILYSLKKGMENIFCSVLFIFSVVLTSLYSFRLVALSVFSDYSFGVFGGSYMVLILSFFPLYVCSIFLGFVFSSYFSLFFKSKVFLMSSVILLIFVGFMLGMFAYLFSFVKFMVLYSGVSYMFFCYYLKMSFKSMFCIGTNLFFILDKGLFSLGMMERLSSIFSYNYNRLYSMFFSVGWLSLMFFSYLFLMAIYMG